MGGPRYGIVPKSGAERSAAEHNRLSGGSSHAR